jgi:hypothetical protein
LDAPSTFKLKAGSRRSGAHRVPARDLNLIPHQHFRTTGLVDKHEAANNCLDGHQFTDRVARL